MQDTYPALIGYVGEVITPEDTDYPGIRQNLQGMDLVKWVVTVDESWYWVDSYPLEEIPADSRTFENGASVHAEAFHYRSAPIVQLDLIWGIGEPFDASVFVHLLCGETIIAQGDGVPLGGFYPFVLWQTDEIRYESRLLGYEPGMDPACLQIRLGLYDSVSGERLRFEDGSDSLTIPVSTESDRG
jgi:hypothetical protein